MGQTEGQDHNAVY